MPHESDSGPSPATQTVTLNGLRDLAARTASLANPVIEWDGGPHEYAGVCPVLPDAYAWFRIRAWAAGPYRPNAVIDTFWPRDWYGPTGTYSTLDDARLWCEKRAVRAAGGFLETLEHLAMPLEEALRRLQVPWYRDVEPWPPVTKATS